MLVSIFHVSDNRPCKNFRCVITGAKLLTGCKVHESISLSFVSSCKVLCVACLAIARAFNQSAHFFHHFRRFRVVPPGTPAQIDIMNYMALWTGEEAKIWYRQISSTASNIINCRLLSGHLLFPCWCYLGHCASDICAAACIILQQFWEMYQLTVFKHDPSPAVPRHFRCHSSSHHNSRVHRWSKKPFCCVEHKVAPQSMMVSPLLWRSVKEVLSWRWPENPAWSETAALIFDSAGPVRRRP